MAWHYVVPLLARSFTVFAYDRRGRGQSGDRPPYSIDREVEDIQALLGAIGSPTVLIGHSAGAIIALRAAPACSIAALVVYEPPYILDGARPRPDPGILETMELLLAQGNREEVLRIAMSETVGVTDEQFEAVRSGHGWPHLLAVAQAVPHDWKAWDEPFDPIRLSAIHVPTLVLVGEQSPAWMIVGADAVHSAIAGATRSILAGQEHFAMLTAPELLSNAITDFLRDRVRC
jgi:pimeloyl-ACP methyl ester carboxylesterase